MANQDVEQGELFLLVRKIIGWCAGKLSKSDEQVGNADITLVAPA